MQSKTKNKIVTIGFIFILFFFLIASTIKKDEEISFAERRKLAQFPNITFENVKNGKTSKQLDEYFVDQFVARDFLRSIKSFWSTYVFSNKDNNGLFLKDDSIYKIEYPLNKQNVQKSASKIKSVYEKYLKGMNTYFAIIPDKNYYLESGYLKIDVQDVQKTVGEELNESYYIDITKSLSLDDYYRTDLHWKQENLGKVVDKIQEEMNLEKIETDFEKQEIGDFYGTYYGQLGRKVNPDKLYILTNDVVENAVTYNYETGETKKVYDKEKLKTSSDKYDIYLSGPTSIITIENQNAQNEKELLLFRDSFGSSLAPLLIQNYKTITLVDLRYVSSSILDRYINFENQDVLFLYSTTVLNQNVLR